MTLSLYEFLAALILSIISTSSVTFIKYTVDIIVNIIKFYKRSAVANKPYNYVF